MHIIDDESGLRQDNEAWLEKLAPHAPTSRYQHNEDFFDTNLP